MADFRRNLPASASSALSAEATLAARVAELERRVAALEARDRTPAGAAAAASGSSESPASPSPALPIAVYWERGTEIEMEMQRLQSLVTFLLPRERIKSTRIEDFQQGQRSILVLRPFNARIPTISSTKKLIDYIKRATGLAPLVIVIVAVTRTPPHRPVEAWDHAALMSDVTPIVVEVFETRRTDEKPVRWIPDTGAQLIRDFIELR